ncbi:MAG: alanine--tRNA ligase [Flavobacteriales bacterium]|nr:alanine--tRNA ligase [Flavobacteriales bacterium]
MESNEIRKVFLDFFNAKNHKTVNSAPLVVKDDPTLMFTNAGMNQFKDIFLGDLKPDSKRVTNSQKCLRVSGKHNDLEEVGIDTYHHTMFEMLGNWSFGDYFKQESIDWAWELLTEVYKIDKDRLYVTIFGGDEEMKVGRDQEAFDIWKSHIDESRIIDCDKKDNFWEMGDTGPCGPCSEIHVDIRDKDERNKVDGKDLVNKDHPQVVELWNLVFITYEKKKNGSLLSLPDKHIDTGMGLERLAMVLQSKKSNYDTDVFQSYISRIEDVSGIKYESSDSKSDIAMRVISDHVRAVAFSISDGQLPSSVGAGYVIRRILRRAVRYAYSTLEMKSPVMHDVFNSMLEKMGTHFSELKKHQEIIKNVLREEESNFLKTIDQGLKRFDAGLSKMAAEGRNEVSGELVFELSDTFGFPSDLTELIASEKGFVVDVEGFKKCLGEQKERSRAATKIDADDWTELLKDDVEEFIGYDYNETEIKITRYRKISEKGKTSYQLVFNLTPFYAEGGGQVGDTGMIISDQEEIAILNTKKENNVILHYCENLPEHVNSIFQAKVDIDKRLDTASNHTGTHLLQQALRSVLGDHVEQKGSLVNAQQLRFDFSHFDKLTKEEIEKIENFVKERIKHNIVLDEQRAIPISEAKKMGAMALFGEKYGDVVRVIKFGDSVELCGGIHVATTSDIMDFKILSESSVAAGIRRIEAVTGKVSVKLLNDFSELVSNVETKMDEIQILKLMLEGFDENDKKQLVIDQINLLLKPLLDLRKKLKDNEELISSLELIQSYVNKEQEKIQSVLIEDFVVLLQEQVEETSGVNCIHSIINVNSAKLLKDIAFGLKKNIPNLFLALGAEVGGKAALAVLISEDVIANRGLSASDIIKEVSPEIKGGGGGQPMFATAGGVNPDGLESALKIAVSKLN